RRLGRRADLMSGDAPVLELQDVTKVYGEDPPVLALRGVSFSVRRGELMAIVGPSGSGKSTLLHVIGTLERPTNGVVRLGGVDAAQLDDRQLSQLRAREIGFVFQQFFLAEHATVQENVADGLLYAGGATIILITHDTTLADRLPRQIRVLDGEVVSDVAHGDAT